MKNCIFTSILFLLGLPFSYTQWEMPCGTIPLKDPWLHTFQQKIPTLQARTDSTIYIPLSIHNVGKDDATGHLKESSIYQAMCILNEDFYEANVQFYIKDTIIYHNRSEWFDHASVIDGAYMMFEANRDSSLNIYIVGNPASNCGYNLPYAGIAMNTACMGPEDHTLAHEVGHAFSLPHTFLGWEGDVYDYKNETPQRVTYDYTYFKDSLILDTTIIDTAFVEYVERKNCTIAGDGFCDTPPDYLSRRWPCNTNDNLSIELQKDPDNVDFRSDGSLIMSYASDICASRFTANQITAVRENIKQRKRYLINYKKPQDKILTESVTLETPQEAEAVSIYTPYFTWSAEPNATKYIFQISRFQDFRFLQLEAQTENPYISDIPGLRSNIKYFWRVKAVNAYDGCTQFSDSRSFVGTESVGTTNKLSDWKAYIYPTILEVGEQFSIQIENNVVSESIKVQLFDLTGVTRYAENVRLSGTSGLNEILVNAPNAPGMYILSIASNQSNQTIVKIQVF